ncbi:MAG TPA: rhodanese-like domain-containing protein [Tepidiformaceae bacterium]|nr:rhodanese-like domain-containing protein [Tepidiformaceae bacterium]
MKTLQFIADALGDASYLLVDGPHAAAIDPQRDVRPLLAAAAQHGATITHVLETHVHNDYLSGGRELAARGATIVAPSESHLAFPHVAIAPDDDVTVGATRLRAVAAPGHTYEHTAYLAIDPSGVAQAAFTGGSILVAATGRTDLLGDAHTPELTRLQWESARRLAGMLPGTADILPTHGAGSFCSTSGSTDERRSMMYREAQRNPALTSESLEAFRRIHLAYEAPTPAYYRHMAPINRSGPRVYLEPPLPHPLRPADIEALHSRGVFILDVRPRLDFAAGHIPRSFGIEESGSMLAYLSWAVPFNAPLVVVAADQVQANRVTNDLFRIGYEDVRGFLRFEEWAQTGRPIEEIELVSAAETAEELRTGATVLDVRFAYEHAQTPLAGAKQLPLDRLADWGASLDGGPYIVVCQSGQRAMIAASALRRIGIEVRALADGGATEVAAFAASAESAA